MMKPNRWFMMSYHTASASSGLSCPYLTADVERLIIPIAVARMASFWSSNKAVIDQKRSPGLSGIMLFPMKTEIIHQYDPPEGWMIAGVLALDHGNYVLYRSEFGGGNTIEVFGSIRRTIDIAAAVDHLQIQHHRLFSVDSGFGLSDWNNSQLLLWPELGGEHTTVRIRQSPDSQVKMRPDCVWLASYDLANETLLVGINSDDGPVEVARYLARIHLPWAAVCQSQGAEINIEWDEITPLDLQYYPKTYYNHQPTAEWLGISALTLSNDTTYVHSKGGMLSRMKSGPEYEFSILSALDENNVVLKNLEVAEGNSSFSSDKRYFIQRPKTRKRLFFYDLESMSPAFDFALKPKQNTENIDGKVLVRADVHGECLCVYSMLHANICRLIA